MITDSWHKRYMGLAAHVATWSKDPSSKVGAVAVNPEDNYVLSIGYNGFPRGIADTQERLEDREKKYPLTVHAEENCIYNATYNGVKLKGSVLYVHGRPICDGCSKAIIQVGISRVIMPSSIVSNLDPENIWTIKLKQSLMNFEETGIEVEILGEF